MKKILIFTVFAFFFQQNMLAQTNVKDESGPDNPQIEYKNASLSVDKRAELISKELNQLLNFDRRNYQQVVSLHQRIAMMMDETRQKFKGEEKALLREKSELDRYRDQQLARYLNAEQKRIWKELRFGKKVVDSNIYYDF